MSHAIHKVTALPGTPAANAIYLVSADPANDAFTEAYATDVSGVAKGIGNTAMIQAIVNASIAGFSSFEIAGTIAQRDALSLSSNTLVLVSDASADATVTAGAALYAWDNGAGSFSKVTEFESMDVVLEWANIQNGPTSTAAQIDAAVGDSHTHANMASIDKIGETAGIPQYDGVALVTCPTTDW